MMPLVTIGVALWLGARLVWRLAYRQGLRKGVSIAQGDP